LYRLLPQADGPSETEFPTCPEFTQLGKFENNRAHSAAFYGLRIFPNFYPTADPCGKARAGNPVPAEFKNFQGYRNGMKAAIASSVCRLDFCLDADSHRAQLFCCQYALLAAFVMIGQQELCGAWGASGSMSTYR
jgi:hypothetical protein